MSHIVEVEYFTGSFIGAVIYGVVIVMFFQCINALLDRTGITKWVFIIHATTMISLTTVAITTTLYALPISYVDNREFPSPHQAPLSGPIWYLLLAFEGPASYLPTIVWFLNNWLVEGLLLYRCLVIYDMNYWAIAFPCLMYLASLTLGVLTLTQSARWLDLIIIVYSIAHSLNILLTLMIVIRVITHARRFRNTTGKSCGIYNTIATILVESCLLYTVPLVLFFISTIALSSLSNLFSAGCIAAQAIPPFFIILRVANQTAFAPGMTAPGSSSSIRFSCQRGLASGTTAGFSPASTTVMDATGGTPGRLCVRAESSHSTTEGAPTSGGLLAPESLIP